MNRLKVACRKLSYRNGVCNAMFGPECSESESGIESGECPLSHHRHCGQTEANADRSESADYLQPLHHSSSQGGLFQPLLSINGG